MKYSLLLPILVLIGVPGYAQIDSLDSTIWKKGVESKLQLSQAAYSHGSQSSTNSVNYNSSLQLFIQYSKNKITWTSDFYAAYGQTLQKKEFVKTNDRLEFATALDYGLKNLIAISSIIDFRTQFSNTYEPLSDGSNGNKTATFLAPANLIVGTGFTYSPKSNFKIYLSPTSIKATYVLDDDLAKLGTLGKPGRKSQYEFGTHLNIDFSTNLGTNLGFSTDLTVFRDYQQNIDKSIDITLDTNFTMKVNKHLSALLSLQMVHDRDILFDVDNVGRASKHRTQFRQIFGIGINFNFGYVDDNFLSNSSSSNN